MRTWNVFAITALLLTAGLPVGISATPSVDGLLAHPVDEDPEAEDRPTEHRTAHHDGSNHHDNETTENQTNLDPNRTHDGPNLVIDHLVWTPRYPEPNDTVQFTAHVVNTGDEATPESEVGFAVDRTPLGTVPLPGLAPGEGVNVTSPNWTAERGEHDVFAVADPRDGINETREDDNHEHRRFVVSERTVQPGRAPNLVVEDVAWTPEYPEPNDTMRFAAHIDNDGTQDSPATKVAFFVDREHIGTVEIGPLEARSGGTNVTSPNWTAEQGDHTIQVVVDPHDNVDELDEGDNAHRERFRVAHRPPTCSDPQPSICRLP